MRELEENELVEPELGSQAPQPPGLTEHALGTKSQYLSIGQYSQVMGLPHQHRTTRSWKELRMETTVWFFTAPRAGGSSRTPFGITSSI